MEMVSPVKRATTTSTPTPRSYDSSRRQAQARDTQRHIAVTARALFIERGYARTSVRDIAEGAGVAVQTIYNAFDGKPSILNRISDMAFVGDDLPVALSERDEMAAIINATDAGVLIERWATMCTGIFVRFLPILPVLREAVGAESSVRERWRQNAVANRHIGITLIAERLDALGAIPRGMTVGQVADLMWTYASFESAEALIVERGWTPDAFAEWTARTIGGLLFVP